MIKAIETVYNGYRFRSRIEARWAVFFDTLGIRYEYEKEGYQVDHIRYLPDFWLPDLQYWIEIKGQKPTDREVEKAQSIVKATGYPCFIFTGLPDHNDLVKAQELQYYIGNFATGYNLAGSLVISANDCLWVECEECQEVRIESASTIFAHEHWCCEAGFPDCISTPRLLAAYTAARQARFEHNEYKQENRKIAYRGLKGEWVIPQVYNLNGEEVTHARLIAQVMSNERLQEAMDMEPKVRDLIEEATRERCVPGYTVQGRFFSYYKPLISNLVGWYARKKAVQEPYYYDAVYDAIYRLLPCDEYDIYPDGIMPDGRYCPTLQERNGKEYPDD